MLIRHTLFLKFLTIIVPVFLVLSALGMWAMTSHDLKKERGNLAARVGNLAARAAGAISRNKTVTARSHAQDMLSALAADRAISCVELKSKRDGSVLNRLPPAQGCKGVRDGQSLVLPSSDDGSVMLHIVFNEKEITNASRLRWNISLLAVLSAFVIALLSAAIGFQLIVGRRLNRLVGGIEKIAESGHRIPVNDSGKDELGQVIRAFNYMLFQDEERERELKEARNALLKANASLERRVDDRTRQLEESMLKATEAAERAEAANKAKSEFMAMLSHELRTPMNGVLGMAGLLDAAELDPQLKHYVHRISQSGTILLNLLDEVLDFSKIESGQLELEHTAFRFADMFEPVLGTMMSRASEKGLTLSMAADPDLPEFLIGDPTRIGQVLFNLIGNAVKFTENGFITVTAHHRQLEEGHVELRFEVKDTGIGIPTDRQAEIFEKFTQADVSTTRRFGGTGLGLAICKQLVEMMGGEIGVGSTPGEGSTFVFTVPCAIGDSSSISTNHDWQQFKASLSEGDGAQFRVLVAEDNIVNQEIIKQMLHSLGLSCDVVADGAEAVEAVQRAAYDIILMDLHMPEMDGLEATKIIRDMPGAAAKTPIIAVTADARAEQGEHYRDQGMDGYVTKPFTEENIVRALAECLLPDQESMEPQVGAVEGGATRSGGPAISDHWSAGAAKDPADQGRDLLDCDVFAEAQKIYVSNPRAFERFVELFVKDSHEKVQVLETALANRDTKTIHETAHSLKSASGFIGAIALSNICRDLETRAADSQPGSDLAGLINDVREMLCDTQKAIDDLAPGLLEVGDDTGLMSALGHKRTSG